MAGFRSIVAGCLGCEKVRIEASVTVDFDISARNGALRLLVFG